jgi:lipopolysaccharide transport system permease protein
MNKQVTINDSASRRRLLPLKELVEYWDFISLLVWRDLHLRYRHTLIGFGWSFLTPLLTMAVFVLIVPNLMSHDRLNASTQGVPYSVFVYCGMAPWAFFTQALTRSNSCMVDQFALLKNMYFSRLALPLAKVLAALVEMFLGLLVLALLMAVERVWPSPNVIFLPLFLIPLVIVSTGLGLALAMLQVRYRDIYFLVQFVLQLGLLVTPVWYSMSTLPQHTRWLLALNPMAAVIEGFRWAVLGTTAPSFGMLALSVLVSLVALIGGVWIFQSREETVADYV